ncbi:MAG: EamA family transporter, partial [Alistipes sp.]
AIVSITVFTYAFYIIGVMKTRAAQIDSMILAFYVLSFGAVYFALYALTTTGITLLPTWDLWRNMLLLALLPTVLSNLTLVLAIKSIGSTMTSILGSMEPLTAVVIGVLHFGERFNIDSAAGLILVIVAVIIVILQAKGKKS